MADFRPRYEGRSSHPSRVRGLKSQASATFDMRAMSHPSRVRGLKFDDVCILDGFLQVAPFTGAWIEMLFWEAVHVVDLTRRTLHGCVD